MGGYVQRRPWGFTRRSSRHLTVPTAWLREVGEVRSTGMRVDLDPDESWVAACPTSTLYPDICPQSLVASSDVFQGWGRATD